MVCCPDGSSLSHSCHLTLCICGKLFQILISARRSIADRGIFPVMFTLYLVARYSWAQPGTWSSEPLSAKSYWLQTYFDTNAWRQAMRKRQADRTYLR
jgi:hypothetical protein